MKMSLLKKLLAILVLGTFSQFAMADNDSASAAIAGVLLNLNHFPSDADKATLTAIAADESNGVGMRAIARAVSNISHAATDADKEVMGQIIAAEQADPRAKALAEIVMGINHMPSDAAKATLEGMI